MADLRIGSAPATVTRPMPAARAEAVKQAQRAFFETALSGEMQASRAPAASAPVTPVSAARTPTFDPAAPQPTRALRPGSLLDIKV